MNHWDSPALEFMLGYYNNGKMQPRSCGSKEREHDHHIRKRWRNSGKYAARIPGLSPAMWTRRAACGDGWALLGRAAGFADP